MNRRIQLEKLIVVLIIIGGFALNVRGQARFNSLPWRMSTAYNKYLIREVHRQYSGRELHFREASASKASMIKYRDECIERYKKIIGNFPEKAALNAQIIGSSQYDGFRIEKIIFESIPNRFVTANMYLPDGDGPFAAVVKLCGHGLGGKIPASQAAILCARNGIATLVVDPIGQGERIQFVDADSKAQTRGATTEHTLLNSGANLLGASLAAYEFWDNHRAVDYLVSRTDIDKTRIGAFGSSGGGTQTSYLVGLDDRIQVATVCSYFSKRERVLELDGPSDGCQHIPYEGREQLEIADFVLMMAPKPVLIMSGKYDFVDYWGATQAFDELKLAYTALEVPEKVSLFTIENGHGMPKPKREAMVSWFRRWMFQDTIAVKETDQPNIPAADLQCTPTGQVITSISGNVSIPEYHLKLANEYEAERDDFLQKYNAEVSQKVMEILGISLPNEEIEVEQTGLINSRNYDLIKYQIVRRGQMPIPCIVVKPETIDPESPVVLYLNEGGKNEILSDETTLSSFVNQHQILICADLRGFGETADPLSLNDTKYWNREYRNAMTSMHIGKPIVGQRVIDIFSLLDFCKSNSLLASHPVQLKANGGYGPAAIHATFLDSRIENTEVFRSVKSYVEYLENTMQRDVYSNVLYGVLNYYDLADLIKLSGGRTRFID
ncbi:acetylxylan esterase [uncultured Sunxiuqinia sp.]|uniref:alpha/beta hydrolase family protein n=1 Tax=uncultured Sunxiuqinia sp. TaxID=1573825 RepID=UPI002AA731E8|nr:acetylxylan esterase [uncultured Sunxiuqinia sp.]